MRPPASCATRRAFTILELLIAVVVIGLLAALVYAKFQDVKERAYVAAMKNDLHNVTLPQEEYFDSASVYADRAADLPGFHFSDDVAPLLSFGTQTRYFQSVQHARTTTTCSIAVGEDSDNRIRCPGFALDFPVSEWQAPPEATIIVDGTATLQQLDSIEAILCPITQQAAPCPFRRSYRARTVRWTFGDDTPAVEGDPAAVATVSHQYPTPGQYPITMTVTTEGGQTLVGRRMVSIGAAYALGGAGGAGGTGGIGAPGTGAGAGTGGVPGGGVLVSGVGAPVAVGASQSKAVVGQPITLTVASHTAAGVRVVSASWAFGDGGSASGSTATHTYTATGSYPVTVTVVDELGQTSTTSFTLVCRTNEVGTLELTADPVPGTAGSPVQFGLRVTGAVVPLTGYAWQFGDGTTSADSTPVHTYAAAGTYTITLTVTDADGFTGTVQAVLQVDNPPAPTARFTVTPVSPQAGQSATFDAATSTPPAGATLVTYDWDFGDFTPLLTSTAPTALHTFSTSGNRSVRLIVTDDVGRADTVTQLVTVAAAPTTLTDTTGLTIWTRATTANTYLIPFSAGSSRTGNMSWVDTRRQAGGVWSGWNQMTAAAGRDGPVASSIGTGPATDLRSGGWYVINPTGATFSLFAVFQMDAVPNDPFPGVTRPRDVVWGRVNGSTNYADTSFVVRVRDGRWQFFVGGQERLGAGAPVVQIGVPVLVTVLSDGTATRLFLNDTEATPPAGSPVVAPDQFHFGWHHSGSAPLFFGRQGETLLYGRAVGDAEHAQVTSYLRSGYGF